MDLPFIVRTLESVNYKGPSLNNWSTSINLHHCSRLVRDFLRNFRPIKTHQLAAVSLHTGERIGALFCELPSNVFLSSVPLQRLRALADEHDFILACDDTVAGFTSLGIIPYVDAMLASLTRMFSGASDVTGGR